MSDLNQCTFIGRLGDNPKMSQTQSGDTMASFSIAVSEKWNDKSGQRQEKTEWINIQAFGKLADIMGQYLQKGSQVCISGKLQSRKYTDQQGIERVFVSILANQMQMLGSNQNQSQNTQGYQNQGYGNQPQGQGYGQGYQGQAPQGYPNQAQPQDYQGQYHPQKGNSNGQRYATTPDGHPIFPPQPIGNQQGKVADDSMPF